MIEKTFVDGVYDYFKQNGQSSLDWYKETTINDTKIRLFLSSLYHDNEKLLTKAFEDAGYRYPKYAVITPVRFLSFCDSYVIRADLLINDPHYLPTTPATPYLLADDEKLTCTPFISLTKEQVIEFYNDLKTGLAWTIVKFAHELDYTKTTVINNFNHTKFVTADFFNKICLLFGLRTTNFKNFFYYCKSKGWITDPSLYNQEFNNLLELSEDSEFEHGEEITFEQTLSEESKDKYITTFFVPSENIAVNSITVIDIEDNFYKPFIISGDKVGIIRGDKYYAEGYYLIADPREPFTVFSNIKMALLEPLDNDLTTFKVSTTNPYLESIVMKKESFKIVACIAFVTRKGSPVILTSEKK
ncbi:hypothetical protein [Psittacicella hinzii]|uniref:Uncharacterized protein n=1 Tax=Psittacicella hinzii TaxID=2028575 RepID=A0A3A1Y8L7_9GAMM|nr:hypothetical protein [Psittacicella hinzii]RIY34532.1 hypothetical protein CKF58_08120 [Psittacicella hinzii]